MFELGASVACQENYLRKYGYSPKEYAAPCILVCWYVLLQPSVSVLRCMFGGDQSRRCEQSQHLFGRKMTRLQIRYGLPADSHSLQGCVSQELVGRGFACVRRSVSSIPGALHARPVLETQAVLILSLAKKWLMPVQELSPASGQLVDGSWRTADAATTHHREHAL